MIQSLYSIINCEVRQQQKDVAKDLGIKLSELDYYHKNHLLPSNHILNKVEEVLGIRKEVVMLKMGIYSTSLIDSLSHNADSIFGTISTEPKQVKQEASTALQPSFETTLGKLFNADCISVMKTIEDATVDLVFADPPFNLDKEYRSNIDDNLHDSEYFNWCLAWLEECVRILKPGGSLFIWNLPKWNAKYSQFLQERLNFRHWIATDIKYRLPIANRLYPSHYSLLYFVKGDKPNTFSPDRLAMDTCPKCYHELKDYGGYKNKMNPKGINLTDVWYDIPPVRHSKYKRRAESNELSIKLLDRIIEMSTKPGDTVFDPFGGSGTTFIVAEIKGRKWIGSELEPTDTVTNRFERIEEEREYLEVYRARYNKLFTDEVKKNRIKRDIWTEESFS